MVKSAWRIKLQYERIEQDGSEEPVAGFQKDDVLECMVRRESSCRPKAVRQVLYMDIGACMHIFVDDIWT